MGSCLSFKSILYTEKSRIKRSGIFLLLSDFAALDGRDGILDRAMAERYRAHGLGTLANLVLIQIDRARQTLGGDIDLGAAVDELLDNLFQTNRNTTRAVALNDDLLVAGQEGDDGRIEVGYQLEQDEIRVDILDKLRLTAQLGHDIQTDIALTVDRTGKRCIDRGQLQKRRYDVRCCCYFGNLWYAASAQACKDF